MEIEWLIELKGTSPVLYFKGVGVPNGENFIFTTNACWAASYKTKCEAVDMIKRLRHIRKYVRVRCNFLR